MTLSICGWPYCSQVVVWDMGKKEIVSSSSIARAARMSDRLVKIFS